MTAAACDVRVPVEYRANGSLGLRFANGEDRMNIVVAGEVLLAAVLFGGLVLAGGVGRRVAKRHLQRTAEFPPGVRSIESAVLALLGLLLAFMFSGAADRFDARKHLIVEEVNAIGVAYLRLDLLPEGEREAVQMLVRRYLDTRIETYRKRPNLDAATAEMARAQALQQEIWTHTAEAARQQPTPIAQVLMPALNSMFDIAATRLAARRFHPPFVVPAMLIGVAFLSAALVGYGLGVRTTALPHLAMFAGTIALTICIILDLEYPRLGLIRVDDVDELSSNSAPSLEPPLEPSPPAR